MTRNAASAGRVGRRDPFGVRLGSGGGATGGPGSSSGTGVNTMGVITGSEAGGSAGSGAGDAWTSGGGGSWSSCQSRNVQPMTLLRRIMSTVRCIDTSLGHHGAAVKLDILFELDGHDLPRLFGNRRGDFELGLRHRLDFLRGLLGRILRRFLGGILIVVAPTGRARGIAHAQVEEHVNPRCSEQLVIMVVRFPTQACSAVLIADTAAKVNDGAVARPQDANLPE